MLDSKFHIPLLLECPSADHITAINPTTGSTARSDTASTDLVDQNQQGDAMIYIGI